MGYPDALLSGTSTGRNTFDPRGIAAAPVAIADCPRWRGDVGPAIGEVQPQVPSRAKTIKALVSDRRPVMVRFAPGEKHRPLRSTTQPSLIRWSRMVVHRRGRVRATAIELHELDPSQRQALLAGLLPAVIDAPRGGAAFPS